MVRWLLLRQVTSTERSLGESLEWMCFLIRTSLRAFVTFLRFLPMTRFRRTLPRGPYHVARIVAVRDEDCGECVQTIVNAAKADGVPTAVLRTTLARRPESLPEDCADAYRFAEKVVTATADEGELREKIRARHGDEALVELALAMAACRVFPITKRALGFGTSCAHVTVEV